MAVNEQLQLIFDEVTAELNGTLPSIPAQPARPDLRTLTCRVCGRPASPHRYPHDVSVVIPARQPKPPLP